MFAWAIIFFLIALVAGVFGFSGMSQDFAYIAKILAIVGLVLAIVSYLFHWRSGRGAGRCC